MSAFLILMVTGTGLLLIASGCTWFEWTPMRDRVAMTCLIAGGVSLMSGAIFGIVWVT